MEAAGGSRIGWTDLPARVRAAVERVLDDDVVETHSQRGGFSPGSADRVVTRRGRRAFVKAVGVELNAQSVALHRREAVVTADLPPSAHAPRLLGSHDDGDWIALVLEDVEGRNPATPWDAGELDRVLAALADLARAPVPAVSRGVLTATADDYSETLAGWERIAADLPADLDPWARANLDRLVVAGRDGVAALRHGADRLVHGDLRADNILLTPDGDLRFVDWPEASVGPGWFDALSVLVNAHVYGGHDVDALAERWLDAERARVDGVLAGFTGYLLDAARRPPPPGLPTVRAFQALQGERTLEWLRRRWGG